MQAISRVAIKERSPMAGKQTGRQAAIRLGKLAIKR